MGGGPFGILEAVFCRLLVVGHVLQEAVAVADVRVLESGQLFAVALGALGNVLVAVALGGEIRIAARTLGHTFNRGGAVVKLENST